jgi:crossover junction endodeoxyribonuclease RusA
MRAFVPKGWTRPVLTSTNPKVKGWQQLVAEQAQQVAEDGLFVGPVAMGVVFHLPRPQSLPKRILHHTKKPDLDKLVRALKDALKGVLYTDDSQVVRLLAHKQYAAIAAAPCAVITVTEAAAPDPTQMDFTTDDLFSEEALHGQATRAEKAEASQLRTHRTDKHRRRSDVRAARRAREQAPRGPARRAHRSRLVHVLEARRRRPRDAREVQEIVGP